jgi:hypothetical protein
MWEGFLLWRALPWIGFGFVVVLVLLPGVTLDARFHPFVLKNIRQLNIVIQILHNIVHFFFENTTEALSFIKKKISLQPRGYKN